MSSGPLPVVFRILAVLIAVIGFYKFFFADDSPTRKVVFITKELGIAGEVTGFNKARGYKIYIDSGDTPYNFDSFENQRILPNTSLGYYLERGDHVEKKPNTDTVIVRRKDQVSKWYLVEPQAQP